MVFHDVPNNRKADISILMDNNIAKPFQLSLGQLFLTGLCLVAQLYRRLSKCLEFTNNRVLRLLILEKHVAPIFRIFLNAHNALSHVLKQGVVGFPASCHRGTASLKMRSRIMW